MRKNKIPLPATNRERYKKAQQMSIENQSIKSFRYVSEIPVFRIGLNVVPSILKVTLGVIEMEGNDGIEILAQNVSFAPRYWNIRGTSMPLSMNMGVVQW